MDLLSVTPTYFHSTFNSTHLAFAYKFSLKKCDKYDILKSIYILLFHLNFISTSFLKNIYILRFQSNAVHIKIILKVVSIIE